jgi:hypothetical protein
MNKIKDSQGKTLVIHHNANDWKVGLNFITEDDEFIQVGTWWYDNEKKLDRHRHNKIERIANITQECVIIMRGSMEVNVYDCCDQFVGNFRMRSGDFAVFLAGGHEYIIKSDNTKIIETKNGPFLGVEQDKTRF